MYQSLVYCRTAVSITVAYFDGVMLVISGIAQFVDDHLPILVMCVCIHVGDGYSYAQPAQQWYPSDNSTPTRPTEYAPRTPSNTSTVMGTHPGSPGYPPQYSQHQEPSNQYQSPGFYQHHQPQQSPPGPGAGPGAETGSAGIAHSSQTRVPMTPATGSSSHLAGNSGVVFSVGEGGAERNNLGASSNSSSSVASASATSASSYLPGGQAVAPSQVRS